MAARFWIAALLLSAAPLPAITIDVAPNSKVPSLAVARDLLRARRREGVAPPFVIRVHGGVYRLGETLVLGPEDSGILIENAPGERPIVSGGRRIEGWGVSPSGPLLTARLSGNIRQLFVAGRRAQRARTPNHGFYRIDGASSENKPFLLRFRGGDLKREWAGSGAEAVALLLWAELRMPIVAIDGATHTATLAGNPPPYNREEHVDFDTIKTCSNPAHPLRRPVFRLPRQSAT
jgi:hypothetical protein